MPLSRSQLCGSGLGCGQPSSAGRTTRWSPLSSCHSRAGRKDEVCTHTLSHPLLASPCWRQILFLSLAHLLRQACEFLPLCTPSVLEKSGFLRLLTALLHEHKDKELFLSPLPLNVAFLPPLPVSTPALPGQWDWAVARQRVIGKLTPSLLPPRPCLAAPLCVSQHNM